MRILVLGAGFGGLELASRLSAEFGTGCQVTLIDQNDGFVFGFSKLDVMFGRAEPAKVVHRYRDLIRPGVRFVQSTIRSIDPVARSVATDAGHIRRRRHGGGAGGRSATPAATPGLTDGGHEFYTNAGAFALRECWSASRAAGSSWVSPRRRSSAHRHPVKPR